MSASGNVVPNGRHPYCVASRSNLCQEKTSQPKSPLVLYRCIDMTRLSLGDCATTQNTSSVITRFGLVRLGCQLRIVTPVRSRAKGPIHASLGQRPRSNGDWELAPTARLMSNESFLHWLDTRFMDRAFSPWGRSAFGPWGDAPGWYGSRRWR